MSYREAYELIDAAVNKADIGYPVTETLKAMFFDQEVENIGLRLVKKSIRASFSVSGKEYVITDSKRSNKIYKVELEDGEILLTIALQSTDPVIWIDARSKENFELDHIPGAILLNEDNWEYLLAEFMEKWNPDLKVIVYCDSLLCRASKNVAQRLQDELQLNNIYTLYGGWETWTIEKK